MLLIKQETEQRPLSDLKILFINRNCLIIWSQSSLVNSQSSAFGGSGCYLCPLFRLGKLPLKIIDHSADPPGHENHKHDQRYAKDKDLKVQQSGQYLLHAGENIVTLRIDGNGGLVMTPFIFTPAR